MNARIRPNVLKMIPYAPGKPIEEVQRELGLSHVVKLASNENPFGPSPKALEAVKKAAERMHIYPDGASFELKSAIASHFNQPLSRVMVGNGSDELIHLIGLIFLGGGDEEMIMGDPAFSRYDPAAHLVPIKLIKVPLDQKFTHDLTAMAAAVTENTRLLFIANPNNPTGTIVRKPDVDRFLADLPPYVTVVLDEAYYEFAADQKDFPNALEYVNEGKNVISLRTFSKAYGLAGIRVGYGFASEEIVDAVNRVREPFDVNSLAQAAAIAALDDGEHMRKTVDNNRRGLDYLTTALRDGGAEPMDSYANFIFADLRRPAEPVFEALLRKGVITRAGRAVGDENCLRVSVGTPDELEFFAKAFKEVMSEA